MKIDIIHKTANTLTFPMLLALLFITLKLTGYIAWSWWWVLSPLLIGLALTVAIALVCGILALFVLLGWGIVVGVGWLWARRKP